MQALLLTLILAVIAAALFLPARQIGERLFRGSVRSEYRLASAINTVILALIFVFVIVASIGPLGFVAGIPGVVVAAEVGTIVSYFLIRFVFGSEMTRGG